MDFDDNYIRRRSYVSRRQKQRRRQRTVHIILFILAIVAILAAIVAGTYWFKQKDKPDTDSAISSQESLPHHSDSGQIQLATEPDSLPVDAEVNAEVPLDAPLERLLHEARRFADSYDYDRAKTVLDCTSSFRMQQMT